MAVDIEDIEFDELLKDKRHKEIRGLLSSLKTAMSEDKSSNIVSAINRNTDIISKFVDAIQNLKIDAPNVNVETNQESVIGSLSVMADSINQSLSEVKEALPKQMEPVKEWEFTIIRNSLGRIDKVIAKAI